MKKIYIFAAVLALLTLSLNAQRLPANQLGGFDFTPTGTATLVAHNNGQFRMPTLQSGEYLFGAYTTDDFDATGIGMSGYYNQAQWITSAIMFDLAEYQDHLGDTIIGFRFALAGSASVNVQSFGIYPTSQNWFSSDQYQIWNLGSLMSGNTTETGSETVLGYEDITITIPNYYIDFNSIQVQSNGTTVTGGSWTYANNGTSLPSGWGGTAQLTAENNGCCTQNGGGTIIIPHSIIDGKENVTVVISARMYSTYSSDTYISIAGATPTQQTYTTTSYASKTWSIPQTTTTVTINTVDVGRGATTSEYLPAYGYNQDYGYRNQMIYRAGQLSMASGSQITSLTFYPEPGQGIPFSGSTVTVSLANTTTDHFTSNSMITSGLTTVATITPVADETVTAWTINFTTPFTYNGGNILVQFLCPGGGSWAHANFLGDDQSANVSLYYGGQNATTQSTGTLSTFLPKATFGFTGSVSTPDYLTLAGGEWHDFFLDEPVEFKFSGDTIVNFLMGYTYYQLNDANFTPIAVNSNSTGHSHYDLMYARGSSSSSYSRGWWGDGVSGSSTSDRPGDMAVQLIFKSKQQKTPQPTITYTYDNGTYYITATATDPDAAVTLTVGGQTANGTGSVTIEVGRGSSDYTVTATAIAQEEGKLASDPKNETIVIVAAPLDPTPTPNVTSQQHDLTVELNGSGTGTVHMYVDGQEVTYPDYNLERTSETYTVTVTITAQEDGKAMSSYEITVTVPAIENFEQLIDGWEVLPGSYTNDRVINWNDNLMFIDRFTASTAHNDQKKSYTYKMTENEGKLTERRETNEHTIPVLTTGSIVNGYFTKYDVDSLDIDRHLPTEVMNADLQMYLDQKSQIYFYTIQRGINAMPNDTLSHIQYNGQYYREMGDHFFNENIPHKTYVQRYDSIGGIYDGEYNVDYLTYVPVVWSFGNDAANIRHDWETAHKHNSYGSPVWKTGAGQAIVNYSEAQMQTGNGGYGATTWTDGEDECCLYFLKVDATGYLPGNSNVDYEPYMFRVWVYSENGNLRGYKYWAEGEDPNLPGAHFTGDGTGPKQQMMVYEAVDTLSTHLMKEFGPNNAAGWAQAIKFAGVKNIDDLIVYVRFYYRSKGSSSVIIEDTKFRAGAPSETPMYYAAEGEDDPGDPSVFVNEMREYGEITSVTYVNPQGMQSSRPFDGVNIVVTRYSDGSTRTTKIVR